MSKRLKVIIVGGSVSGLTLAHSLRKLGIDCTILERRREVAPQEGASIAIFPNGARVLDQLGVWSPIEKAAVPLGNTKVGFPDGFQFDSTYPKEVTQSFGYPIAFLERQQLLEILYNTLPNNTDVLLNKTVTDIVQYSGDKNHSIGVRTADGSVYDGDLVVGADGVHSQIRGEIWRLHGPMESDKSLFTEEYINVSVEYSCVFGISRDFTGLTTGQQIMRMYERGTLVVIPAKGDVVFWFLVQKLDRKYSHGEVPHFTDEQATQQCEEIGETLIENAIRFKDIFEKQSIVKMLPLEENFFKTWSFGSAVCIGDSVHKMTINFGQGANCAIEGVAALSNLLQAYLSEADSTSNWQNMDHLLKEFNRTHTSRAHQIWKMSYMTTRLHAGDGSIANFSRRYIIPYFGPYFQSRPLGLLADGVALDFLPLPKSSFPGWKKYKSEGNGKPIRRFFQRSLALLAIAAIVCVYYGGGLRALDKIT